MENPGEDKVSEPVHSEIILLKQQATKNAQCVALVVIFVCVQLCVCLKYFHVGLIEVYTKIHGQQATESSGTDREEEFNQVTPGFPMPTPRRFFSGSFQDMFENALQTNFLLPETALMPIYRRLVMKLSNLSLGMMSESLTWPRPLWGEYTLAQDRDGDRICSPPTVYRQADRSKLLARASYYNDLHAAWPEVHFYVFPVLSAADLYAVEGLYGSGAKKQLAGDRYAQEFRALLDPAIGYAWATEGWSFKDAISCYYRTDHHLSFPGAYKVYRHIWQLLRQQDHQIGSYWDPKGWVELPNIRFYGSLARSAANYDTFNDVIVDGIFELPELKIRIYGFEGKQRNEKSQYQAGHYGTMKFDNHYAKYFGTDYGLIEYTSVGGGYGSLLVIGDSFDNCIEPLLASHFPHSYFVDLRLYAKDVGKEFDMDDFLAQRGITDILFLGNQYWLLGLKPLEPYKFR